MSRRRIQRSGRARIVIGAAAWILTLVYFLAQPVVALAWAPRSYSWAQDYISDLGMTSCTAAVCSPRHLIMNVAFAATGALIVIGAVLLWPALPWTARAISRLGTVGAVLIIISGLGITVVGLFPADVSPAVHGASAALHIPLQNLGLILLGIGLTTRRLVARGLITMIIGIAGLLGTAMFFSGRYGPLGRGGSERLADYPFVGWFVLAGLVLAARRPEPLR